MKIALFSDLHLEFNKNFRPTAGDADVVVLAGDIAHVEDALSLCQRLVAEYQVPVVYVPGNHEYYKQDLDRLNSCLRNWQEPSGLVHVLVERSVVIGGVRFIGTPLWTNFQLYGQEKAGLAIEAGLKFLPDFKLIRRGDSVFSPEDAINLHEAARQFLRQELESAAEDCVVVTHFAPHEDCCAPQYLTSPITPYFINNCSDLIETYQPRLWLFGHTHHSVDFRVGETRIVANQHGYAHEVGKSSGFDPDLRIVVKPTSGKLWRTGL